MFLAHGSGPLWRLWRFSSQRLAHPSTEEDARNSDAGDFHESWMSYPGSRNICKPPERFLPHAYRGHIGGFGGFVSILPSIEGAVSSQRAHDVGDAGGASSGPKRAVLAVSAVFPSATGSALAGRKEPSGSSEEAETLLADSLPAHRTGERASLAVFPSCPDDLAGGSGVFSLARFWRLWRFRRFSPRILTALLAVLAVSAVFTRASSHVLTQRTHLPALLGMLLTRRSGHLWRFRRFSPDALASL
jgi:hypothetical protein